MIENICHLEAGVNDASTPFPQSFLFLVRPFLLDRQSANNMLGAIAEEEEEEDVRQQPPPPPPPPGQGSNSKASVIEDDMPPPPPPLAMKKGRMPPPPPPAVNSKANDFMARRSHSPPSGRASPSVPVSKIRRATQMFMDDPTMKKLAEGLANSSPEKDKKGAKEQKSFVAKMKEKREEDDMQMLRGIFAAFDENKNGRLSRRELSDALIALGFSPTEALMNKFYTENLQHTGKKSWQISLPAFVTAALKHLDSAVDCTEDVMYLFKSFDRKLSGDVSAKMVRHLLHETLVPTRLTEQETTEFLNECIRNPNDLSEVLKYGDLVDRLLFAPSDDAFLQSGMGSKNKSSK